MKLSDSIENWLARKPLESLAEMPDILFVRNLVHLEELNKKYSGRERLVIFAPQIVDANDHMMVRLGRKIRGIRIRSKNLAVNMASLYLSNTTSSNSEKVAIAQLSAEIEKASEKRDEEMRRLSQSTQKFSGEPSDAAIRELVEQVVKSQFERPESLIREAVQNADGSWKDKLSNRIDVYLDQENRTIAVYDEGRGMPPDVVKNKFFNLYASLNEELDYAAGKFGLGTASFFGVDHERVTVDTRTREGEHECVVVDSDLNRVPDQPSCRSTPGTTVSIKLKDSSRIDFKLLEDILREDCAYLETPIYLHQCSNSDHFTDERDPGEPINQALLPPADEDTLRIEEKKIQGYLRRCDGDGHLEILCHRIKLSSLQTSGYSGAINCSALETTFSRDSVMQDPVMQHALKVVRLKAKRLLQPVRTDPAALSLPMRAKQYGQFVKEQLLNKNSTVNEQFCINNFTTLAKEHHLFKPTSMLAGIIFTFAYLPFLVGECIKGSLSIQDTFKKLVEVFFDASTDGDDAFAKFGCFLVLVGIILSLYVFKNAGLMGFIAGFDLCGGLVVIWFLEVLFWSTPIYLHKLIPLKIAGNIFNRFLREDPDWFRRPSSVPYLVRNAAIFLLFLTLYCILYFVIITLLSPLLSIPTNMPWSLPAIPPVIAVAPGGSDNNTPIPTPPDIPWGTIGGVVIGATIVTVLGGRDHRKKFEFRNEQPTSDQQALIDDIKKLVGDDVAIGYSRGLTSADAKACFKEKRICLNRSRSSSLDAPVIAYSYLIDSLEDYDGARKAVGLKAVGSQEYEVPRS